MVKVLHVLGGLNLGGAESRIMDLYRHMDREQVQFDFLVHMSAKEYARAIKDGINPEEYRTPQHYDEEIRALGGYIYALPRYKVYNQIAYKKAIKRFFKEHNDYSVVQGHMTSTASLYLPIAKAISLTPEDDNPGDCIIEDDLGTTLITVAHTRNAGVDKGPKGWMTKFLRRTLPKKADFLFACSHLAGDETFNGAHYTYVPNTIDTKHFKFNSETRMAIRDLYDIPSNVIVIGNVARFNPQKNHRYLIDAFAKLCKETADVYLLLCGDGMLKEKCEEQVAQLDIKDKVIFAGNQSEVQDYYSAMDIFAFPSIYEGLPGVVVEAQASGLYCIISDTITKDVHLTDRLTSMSIASAESIWTQRLMEVVDKLQKSNLDEENASRELYVDIVANKGFDVNAQAKRMMEFYLNPCKETLPE